MRPLSYIIWGSEAPSLVRSLALPSSSLLTPIFHLPCLPFISPFPSLSTRSLTHSQFGLRRRIYGSIFRRTLPLQHANHNYFYIFRMCIQGGKRRDLISTGRGKENEVSGRARSVAQTPSALSFSLPLMASFEVDSVRAWRQSGGNYTRPFIAIHCQPSVDTRHLISRSSCRPEMPFLGRQMASKMALTSEGGKGELSLLSWERI